MSGIFISNELMVSVTYHFLRKPRLKLTEEKSYRKSRQTKEKEQEVITESKVKEIFTAKNFNTFKKGIENIAKSHAEKATLVNLVKKLNLNEYDKIKFIEAHTGMEVK